MSIRQKQSPADVLKNRGSKNFANFTGQHLWQSFLNKVAGLKSDFMKKALTQVLFCEFCEMFKCTFSQDNPWTLLHPDKSVAQNKFYEKQTFFTKQLPQFQEEDGKQFFL